MNKTNTKGLQVMSGQSKAVVTVIGFDRKGIIARVSNVLYEAGINILEISQTIVDGFFNMVMIWILKILSIKKQEILEKPIFMNY